LRITSFWTFSGDQDFKDIPVESAEELIASSDLAGVESSLDLQLLMTGISPKARVAIQYVKLQALSGAKQQPSAA
jgi:hypothetical protein